MKIQADSWGGGCDEAVIYLLGQIPLRISSLTDSEGATGTGQHVSAPDLPQGTKYFKTARSFKTKKRKNIQCKKNRHPVQSTEPQIT